MAPVVEVVLMLVGDGHWKVSIWCLKTQDEVNGVDKPGLVGGVLTPVRELKEDKEDPSCAMSSSQIVFSMI